MLCCAGGSLEGTRNVNQHGNGSVNQASAIRVTAPVLISEYEANEIAADQRYKGKTVVVTGKVDHVGKDIMDSMYVTLRGDKEFGIVRVQCFFDDSWATRLSYLREGDTVTVNGTCDGKFGNVLLKDCSFPSK
jgi:hypothetical protein